MIRTTRKKTRQPSCTGNPNQIESVPVPRTCTSRVANRTGPIDTVQGVYCGK